MIRYGVFLILLLLTFGCRKDLCYDHELHSASVKTVVAADWEQEWERTYDFDWEQNWNVLWGREYDELRPDIAEGIRALVYSAGGGFSENNLSAEGGRLPMKEGVHSLPNTFFLMILPLRHLLRLRPVLVRAVVLKSCMPENAR